ncbi:unnamed protein product [Schistosoma turkestanicum]|nr:unnamed protein product [Schistosoma turkestanicum]
MMELAKKNVHHTLDKKRPFDDLIPCSVDSKYRKLDSSLVDSSKPIPNALKNVSKPKSHVGSNLPESLVPQKAKLPKLSNSIGSKGFDKTDRGSVMEEVVQHLEKSNRVPYKPLHKNNLSGQRTTNLNRPSKLEMTDSKSSELTKTSKINPLKECKALPKSSTNSKLVNSNFVNKGKSVTAPSKKIVSRTSDNVKAPSTRNFPASNKDAIKNVHMNSNQKSKENPQSRSVDNRTQRTGIAAQLGISFQSQNSANLSVSDSAEDDEYMSDDSFIDDSEALQSKEYARVVRDIHRALKFDPRKYKDVNPYEDLRCMEAKYCDIEKEERRSARLAALEDNEELIRDMMRRKEKMAKKRQQFLNDNDND